MKKRVLVNLALGGSLLAFAVILLKLEGGEREPAVQRVSSLDPASVRQIRITRPGRQDILIDRGPAGWQIRQPVLIPANPFRIGSILELPVSPSLARFSAPVSGLEGFGLSPAEVILSLDDHRFYFGGVNPLDRGRYLLKDGLIHIIEDRLYPQLVQDAGFFMDPRLLAEGTGLVRISYPHLELVREGDIWRQAGGEPRLAEGEPARIAAAWRDLEATAVKYAEQWNGTGLGKIALKTSRGEGIILQILSADPELILLRPDKNIIYRLPRGKSTDFGLTLTHPQ